MPQTMLRCLLLLGFVFTSSCTSQTCNPGFILVTTPPCTEPPYAEAQGHDVQCSMYQNPGDGGNCYTDQNCEVCRCSCQNEAAIRSGCLKTATHSCEPCIRGKYKTDNAETCSPCPPNSVSPSASTDVSACQCKVGWTGISGQECSQCSGGKYKTSIGSDDCSICPSDSSSPEGSDEKDDCICSAGSTGPDGDDCMHCVAGKYKTTTGNAACSDCIKGEYSTDLGATSNTCQKCPTNSISVKGSAECICDPGSTGPDADNCIQCVAGKFKISNGSDSCLLCNVGKYSTAVGASTNTCQRCPRYSSSKEASVQLTDCICDSGSTGLNGDTCTQCVAGKFKILNGSDPCLLCDVGEYSTVVGASANTCQTCPISSSSLQGSAKLTDCICNAGSTGQNGGPCVLCQGGKYKTDTGSGACDNKCPQNSHSEMGATSISNCLCGAGYTQVNSSICSSCSAGKYKIAIGIHGCTECLVNQYSNTGGDTVNRCQDCPIHSHGPKANDNIDNCKCDPGKEKSDGQDLCKECVAGKFKNETGNHLCSACVSTVFSLNTGATTDETCLYQYKTTISFSMYGSTEFISAEFVFRFMHEVSVTLGLDISKLTEFDFRKSPTNVRRLLSVVGFFSIISDSKNEADSIESIVDVEWLNRILVISSQNTINASSFEMSRTEFWPIVEKTPVVLKDPDITNKPKNLYVWIVITGVIFLCIIILGVLVRKCCISKPENLRPARFDVTSSNYYCEDCDTDRLYCE